MNEVTFTAWSFWVAFACVFMVMSIAGQHLTSQRRTPALRKVLLLAFSLGFYVWVAGKLVVILLFSVWINHGLTRVLISTTGRLRQLLVTLAVGFNVGLLGLFKYAYFVSDWWPNSTIEFALQSWRLDQWMLPIGLSFFTFQAISYVLDVHRGTLKAPTSLLSFATYLSFFPQLVAGPIVRAGQFLPQLESRSWVPDKEQDRQHIQRILTGFLKKVLLGDFIGAWIVDPVFTDPTGWSSVEIWIALYGYSLQVYADFSGYTDMAKGMAGLLGISLPENFNRPYKATSPSDFWRRWHITLSAWWKDYVYIPMGGNRRFSAFSLGCLGLACAAIVWRADNLGVSLVASGVTLLTMAVMLLYPKANRRVAHAVNVFLVMLMGGLWHGAHMNFIVWGALNGVVLSAWIVLPLRSDKSWSRWLGWLVTFHTVVASRIWFRAGSLVHWDDGIGTPHPEGAWDTAWSICHVLTHGTVKLGSVHWQPPYLAGLALLGIGFGLHFLPEPVSVALQNRAKKTPTWVLWAGWLGAALLSTWAPGTHMRPFIYWQF